MHTMPGLKNASSSGLLNVTWYDRRGKNAGSGRTDIFVAVNVNPRTSSTPSNKKFTNVTTDWLATSSVIIPNFGDYTDNFVSSSNVLYVTWSDGVRVSRSLRWLTRPYSRNNERCERRQQLRVRSSESYSHGDC